jgi:hypothetical protein
VPGIECAYVWERHGVVEDIKAPEKPLWGQGLWGYTINL